MSTTLQEMGPEAVAHRDELEDVKRRMGIRHDFFDCWIYGFLENKKFNIDETVAKLQRRDQMERDELAKYDITDYMRETMAKGIIQLIGEDKEGRLTFYIVTRRDHPTSKRREENKRNFDMWLSYGTRLRKENRRCRIAMLINQKDASMWSNTDMTFQADVALRIAKYYPGAVDRMYICKMSNTLAAMAKPIFARLPAIVSERIRIFTEGDLQKGKLLDLYDENVLPVDLGGKNDCDGPKNWTAFAKTIEDHFSKLKTAVGERGLTVKEWELECLQQELSEATATNRERREARHILRSTRRQSMFASASGGYGATATERPVNPEDIALVEDDTRSADLLSCFSDDDYYDCEDYEDGAQHRDAEQLRGDERAAEDGKRAPSPGVGAFGEPEAALPSHQNSAIAGNRMSSFRVPPTLQPLHRFLLEEERRWRQTFVIQEAEARLLLCDRRLGAIQETHDDIEDVFGTGGSRRLTSYVPAPARTLVNFFLHSCCALSALYFAGATLFFAAVVCSISVNFFFGMFADPTYVFPVGVAMLLAGTQGSMLCSRGVELTRLSYYGRLLPGFRHLGSYAQPAQLIFTFALILTQFIIFVVYAVRWDTLNGLKVAFATGWMSCAILVALHHVLYWVQAGEGDWDPLAAKGAAAQGDRKSSNDASKGALPIYLLFDLTEDDEDESPTERTSALLMVLLPVLASLLLGTAFLVSKALVFAVATPVATLTAAWALNAYVEDATQKYYAVPTKYVTWFASVTWLFNTYTFGFRDYSLRWATPVIAMSLICALFIVMAAWSHKKGNSSRVLRLALILIVAYTAGCIIMSFIVVKWSLGVFSVVMALHCGLCLSRNSGRAITITGRFIVSAGTALVIIACVMLGWIGTTELYDVPRSAASGPRATDPMSPLYAWSYPSYLSNTLCGVALDLSGNRTAYDSIPAGALTQLNATTPLMSMVDIILLTEVSAAATDDTFATDFATWFPGGRVSTGRKVRFPAAPTDGDLTVFSLTEYSLVSPPTFPNRSSAAALPPVENVSVWILQSAAKMHSIQSMTAWAEAISLSPLSIFLPLNWTKQVIDPYAFSTFMIPFPWWDSMQDVEAFVRLTIQRPEVQRAEQRTYLAGFGTAGGVAQLIGGRTATSSIAFNAPGIMQLLDKFSIARETYNENILTVNANDAALSTIGGAPFHGNVEVNCGYDADTCQSIGYLTRSMLRDCEPDGRQHA